MNRFEMWFLKRIFKKQVKQGPWHHLHIIELYMLIRESVEDEFTEDNRLDLYHFLVNCFSESLGDLNE